VIVLPVPPVSPSPTAGASIADACAYFGVSDDTIRRWIADGRLTAHRYGPRLIRVQLESLEPTPIGGNP
jgi:excisionase family DNA binding protein